MIMKLDKEFLKLQKLRNCGRDEAVKYELYL